MSVVALSFMFFTLWGLRFNIYEILLANIAALTTCIIYQFKRQAFRFFTIGELIIGNWDKANILTQNSKFAITRIPLFILLLITLILNGNIGNALADGLKFSTADVIYCALTFICLYYGLKNFFLKPDWLPLILICGGVFLAGSIFKRWQNITLFDICYVTALIWLLLGLLYKTKSISNVNNQ